MVDETAAVKIPDDCFVAHSFNVAPCPCGCGTFKLVGFDEKGVARALIAIEPYQFVLMMARAVGQEVGVGPALDSAEKETKH